MCGVWVGAGGGGGVGEGVDGGGVASWGSGGEGAHHVTRRHPVDVSAHLIDLLQTHLLLRGQERPSLLLFCVLSLVSFSMRECTTFRVNAPSTLQRELFGAIIVAVIV